MSPICALKEATANTGEEGFAGVKPEKAVRSISGDPAPKASMSDSCPALKVKSGAFECLQEDEVEAEEGQTFVFQSEKSLYEEKERMQRGHAGERRCRKNAKTVNKCPSPEAANTCYRLGARRSAARDQTRACEGQQEIQKKVRADDDDMRSRRMRMRP